MMAAPAETHVKMSGDDTHPEFEEEGLRGDKAGSNGDEGSAEEEEQPGDDDDGDDDGGGGTTNPGWAEAMAKILAKKTPGSRSAVLLKNKELDKVKEKEKQEQLESKKQRDEKRSWEMMCRQKPDLVKDREAEKALQRVATRGVVQLFNAVRRHQKTVEQQVKEVGGSERKKAKLLSSVSKKDFIHLLRRAEGGAGAQAATAEEKPAWSVLREDFMMGATMKDWDKESDGEDADGGGATGQ